MYAYNPACENRPRKEDKKRYKSKKSQSRVRGETYKGCTYNPYNLGDVMTAYVGRRAVAGHCVICGRRVMRGEAEDGELIDVDVFEVRAADELRALAHGRSSFVLRLSKSGGVEIGRRTLRDIKLKPAGMARDRVVLAHRCRGEAA